MINKFEIWTSKLSTLLRSRLRRELLWFCFGFRTQDVCFDFLIPKPFEPRHPFLYTSKYGNFPVATKKFKFLSPQVFQIFDFKHGFPENYSFFLKLFFFFPNRTMRCTSHILSKYLSNHKDILQSYRGVNVVVWGTFWVHSVKGFRR